MNGITGINSLSGIDSIANTSNKVANDDTGFKTVLDNLVNQVNETDAADQQQNLQLITGNIDNLHDVVISGEKADLALRLTTQVRNKMLDAYTEIMRMQI